ncbi:MAG: Penicillin-Binding Protein C-terminus Family [Thermoplasmata archaeon]|nr:Penicillin-Binding Protein C-terminus Family [Thermoplasmata archaeon]
MMWALAALLLVQPVLEEPGTLRLVATGPPGPVEWLVDGQSVGSAAAREPIAVQAGPGPHAGVARASHSGPWQVVVRLDKPGPGIAYAPAWTASSAGDGPRVIPGLSLGVVGAALAAAAWAQSKRP